MHSASKALDNDPGMAETTIEGTKECSREGRDNARLRRQRKQKLGSGIGAKDVQKQSTTHEDDIQDCERSGQACESGNEQTTIDGRDQDSGNSFETISESDSHKNQRIHQKKHPRSWSKDANVQTWKLGRDTKKTDVETGHGDSIPQRRKMDEKGCGMESKRDCANESTARNGTPNKKVG